MSRLLWYHQWWLTAHLRWVVTAPCTKHDPTPAGPRTAAVRTPASPVAILSQHIWGQLCADAFITVLQMTESLSNTKLTYKTWRGSGVDLIKQSLLFYPSIHCSHVKLNDPDNKFCHVGLSHNFIIFIENVILLTLFNCLLRLLTQCGLSVLTFPGAHFVPSSGGPFLVLQ